MQRLRASIATLLVTMTTAACAARPASSPTVPSAEPVLPFSSVSRPTPTPALDVDSPAKRASFEQGIKAKQEGVDKAPADLDQPVATDAPIAAAPEPQRAELPQSTTAECPAAGTRVLLIGDSLSAGLGHPMARLAARCGTPFHHHGVVGSHATQWVNDGWLLPQLDRAKPTHVLLSMGGNDFMRNDPANVQRAVDRLIAKVRSRGIVLLWISPPTMPFEDKAGVRRMWQQGMGGAAGNDWYPAEDLVIARSSDQIHPTQREYRNLSALLWRWMSTRTASA